MYPWIGATISHTNLKKTSLIGVEFTTYVPLHSCSLCLYLFFLLLPPIFPPGCLLKVASQAVCLLLEEDTPTIYAMLQFNEGGGGDTPSPNAARGIKLVVRRRARFPIKKVSRGPNENYVAYSRDDAEHQNNGTGENCPISHLASNTMLRVKQTRSNVPNSESSYEKNHRETTTGQLLLCTTCSNFRDAGERVLGDHAAAPPTCD